MKLSKNFVKDYTGENELCYVLNRILRDCNVDHYDEIKAFCGHFSYELYDYAKRDKKGGGKHGTTRKK